jgi:hypothetical protein
MSRPFADAGTQVALDRAIAEARGRIRQEGPVLEVEFPIADTARDIAHGLGRVPTGVIVVLQSGGVVTATDVARWTADLAYLAADTAHTRARLYFVVTEDPRRVA